MIGAHPAGSLFAGVAYALGAACCRTAVLLVTRAYLVGGDARLTTWYSVLSSTVVFVGVSAADARPEPAADDFGLGCRWSRISLATTAGILFDLRIDYAHRAVPHGSDHAS